MRKFQLLILLITTFCQLLIGQETANTDRVYNSDIKSVKLHRTEWNLSYPLITLNSEEKLILQFDQLGANVETYYYTFIHCDKEWKQSDIYPSDYLNGFSENQIENYEMSFNTTVNYVHYSITFPNQDVSFNNSGNYILKVYPMGDPDRVILTRRFMISENTVSIDADPQRPKLGNAYDTGQQVDFTVEYPAIKINDPYRNVSASILQNGRWDNAKTLLKPDFIGNSNLVYNDITGKTVFDAGSEFRYFDIKSLRYLTQYVRSIEHEYGNYHAYLMVSENRSGKQYFYTQDFNGKYYTAIQEGRDHEIEADYIYVYFSLASPNPVMDANVYIFGALSDWDINENNRMIYNDETRRYEATLLLKQGWYNYTYHVSGKDDAAIPDQTFESNHFDTENDYLILVYLSEPMDRYDRLIGAKISNTLNGRD